MKGRITALLIALLLFLAALCGRGGYLSSLSVGETSERWRGQSETQFRRISVYFEPHMPYNASGAEDAARMVKSWIAEGDEEIAPLMVWGNVGEAMASAGEHEIFCTAVSATEGFFSMRGFPVKSGAVYHFGEWGFVLNRYAAFALFGSEDCVGWYMKCDEARERVIAVVEDGEEAPVIYRALPREGEVTFFEAILPEYIKGYAKEQMEKCFYAGDSVAVRENDRRYETSELRADLKRLFDKETQPITFRVPFWEAREARAGRVLMVWNGVCVLLVLPLVFAAVFAAWRGVPLLWDTLRETALFQKLRARREKKRI